MTENQPDMTGMDDAFEDLRARAPAPSTALIDRVLADAAATQAGFAPGGAPDRAIGGALGRGGVPAWRGFLRVLGGWPAVAGLATATVAGVVLGAYPPDILPEATGFYLGLGDAAYSGDPAPGLGFDGFEEAL